MLEGRPSQIVEHKRDLEDIFGHLNELVPGFIREVTVDSGAVEDEPEELPPAA